MKGYAFGVMYHDNWKWLKEYRPEVLKLIESKGGKYLAVGNNPQMREGQKQPAAYVLLEFPNLESAEKLYEDPDYQPLLELRNSTGKTDFYIFEGIEEN